MFGKEGEEMFHCLLHVPRNLWLAHVRPERSAVDQMYGLHLYLTFQVNVEEKNLGSQP